MPELEDGVSRGAELGATPPGQLENPVQDRPDISKLSLAETPSAGNSPEEEKRSLCSVRGSSQEPASLRRWSPSSPPTFLDLSCGSSSSPSTPWSAGLPLTPRTPGYEQSEPYPRALPGRRGAGGDGGLGAPAQPDTGRYLMAGHFPKETTVEQVQAFVKNLADYKAILVKHLSTKGCVFIIFHDSRDAAKVLHRLQTNDVRLDPQGPACSLRCIKVERAVVEKELGLERFRGEDPFSEAVVVVEIVNAFGVQPAKMRQLLVSFGDLAWFREVELGRTFCAEFYDTRDAQACVEALQGYSFQDARLRIDFECSDPFAARQPKEQGRETTHYTLGSAAYRGALPRPSDRYGGYSPARAYSDSSTSLPSTPRAPGSPFHAVAPVRYGPAPPSYGRSGPGSRDGYGEHSYMESFSRRMKDPAALQGVLDNMDISARVRHGEGLGGHWDPRDSKSIPIQNRVIPERIISGLDQRTTVMIKDVPNKLSRDELVAVLSEVVPNEFDFVYLRFDFNNCCNVGYAFVNFTSVKALYDFIQAKVGRKWNMFSSEKVLQVSYANIQGKSALVNKFKNSAVMTVMEQWRPLIFYSSGALKGQAEPFPESDNPLVRHRSTESRWASLASSTLPPPVKSPGNMYEYAESVFESRF